jgi:hypothetical protein
VCRYGPRLVAVYSLLSGVGYMLMDLQVHTLYSTSPVQSVTIVPIYVHMHVNFHICTHSHSHQVLMGLAFGLGSQGQSAMYFCGLLTATLNFKGPCVCECVCVCVIICSLSHTHI